MAKRMWDFVIGCKILLIDTTFYYQLRGPKMCTKMSSCV